MCGSFCVFFNFSSFLFVFLFVFLVFLVFLFKGHMDVKDEYTKVKTLQNTLNRKLALIDSKKHALDVKLETWMKNLNMAGPNMSPDDIATVQSDISNLTNLIAATKKKRTNALAQLKKTYQNVELLKTMLGR